MVKPFEPQMVIAMVRELLAAGAVPAGGPRGAAGGAASAPTRTDRPTTTSTASTRLCDAQPLARAPRSIQAAARSAGRAPERPMNRSKAGP